ncbi:MAG: hypothetical protein PHH11_18020 [Methylomonas sp.]|nr:hypothetical protein [Methylomonas sp.]
MKTKIRLKSFTATALLIFTDLSWGDCKNISGTVQLIPEMDTCSILQRTDTPRKYPTLTFLYSLGVPGPTCFVSEFSGQINRTAIHGDGVSGMTLSSFNAPQALNIDGHQAFTAATTLRMTDSNNNLLGTLYLMDSGINSLNDVNDPNDDTTNERLVVIGGTGMFQKYKGQIDIVGNEFSGANIVQGRICE